MAQDVSYEMLYLTTSGNLLTGASSLYEDLICERAKELSMEQDIETVYITKVTKTDHSVWKKGSQQ